MARKRIIVKKNSWLARLASIWMRYEVVALVWGRTIHLYGTEPDKLLAHKSWLAHELVHVRQYETMGLFGFLRAYLWEWIKHGYHNNRYEIEARMPIRQQESMAILKDYNFEIK